MSDTNKMISMQRTHFVEKYGKSYEYCVLINVSRSNQYDVDKVRNTPLENDV